MVVAGSGVAVRDDGKHRVEASMHGSSRQMCGSSWCSKKSETATVIPQKRIFLIAPTICMKTKAKFRPRSIAPTISMKANKLLENWGFSHDVIEGHILRHSWPP